MIALEGRAALVIGGNRGIGRAVALFFARAFGQRRTPAEQIPRCARDEVGVPLPPRRPAALPPRRP